MGAYAHLRERLPPHVRVFAFDGETSDELDNKFTFNQVLVKAGLPCPETANMECLEDAVEFFRRKESAPDDGKRYIVKPAVYDPKARTEILFLPIPDKKRQLEYLQSRNASKEVPYVIQEVLQNPEYGSFAIFNNGALTGFEFFESAASCLVYRRVLDKRYDQVLELNKGLGKAMNLTGQLTLDLMHTARGDMVPIECNPRIHSAVCTLEGHRNIGAMYTAAEQCGGRDLEAGHLPLLGHGSALLDGRVLEAQELLQVELAGDGHGHRCHPLRRRSDALLGHVLASDPFAFGLGDSARHPMAQGGLLHWQDREGRRGLKYVEPLHREDQLDK